MFKSMSRPCFGSDSVHFESEKERAPPWVLPGGGFILTGRRVDRALGLTSAITSGVAALYGESVGVEAWCEGVTRHATFMAHCTSSAGAAFNEFHFGCRHGYGAGADAERDEPGSYDSGRDSSDDDGGWKRKLEVAWLSKALEPALQLYKWASSDLQVLLFFFA
ncbi:hypothetical protein BHM03_00013475 [Ensete ventricosum]|nr:hypothetical protein BHM03_00013475 [Ensete ventricosum]